LKKVSILYLLCIVLFYGCNNSKWETIHGKGINDDPKSVDEAIYFEDEDNGVVGGHTLISDNQSNNDFKLSFKPILYLTQNGGKRWTEINFNTILKESVQNVYLRQDTLICQFDSCIFFSTDKGQTFSVVSDSVKQSIVKEKYFNEDHYSIDNENFEFEGVNYVTKEFYANSLASVMVCYGPEKSTDYYFVSFDKGKYWKFLQKDCGNNRKRFLLQDRFLYCYGFPFGLQRLRLK